MSLTVLQPPGWPPPKGYSNGMLGQGRIVLTGGVVGWDAAGRFPAGLVPQVEQVLRNILLILAEAGCTAEHVARLTWYVRSVAEYRAAGPALGAAYRRVMGRHFPAMALVGVADLVEPDALVEIEATAILPPFPAEVPPHA